LSFGEYYEPVKITIPPGRELIKKIRRIAADRCTTLTGLVHDYLENLAAEDAASGRKRESLERSFC
jgi:hypothetical protein